MTYYVGVDIAKYEHVASIVDSKTGELIVDSLHFDNSLKGFKELLSHLSKLNNKDVLVGFESTAHYHQALFNYLTEHHYKCYLINPLMISRFRSISLRDSKNDNIDSRAISNFLLLEHKNLINEDNVVVIKGRTSEKSTLPKGFVIGCYAAKATEINKSNDCLPSMIG